MSNFYSVISNHFCSVGYVIIQTIIPESFSNYVLVVVAAYILLNVIGLIYTYRLSELCKLTL